MLTFLYDSPDDTSRINSLTREGIKYISNPAKTEKADAMALAKAKACIDSAVLICGKKKIEIPALLHLLSAEHSLFSGDTRNAFEEASLAMKQAENSGESEARCQNNDFLWQLLSSDRVFHGEYGLFWKEH